VRSFTACLLAGSTARYANLRTRHLSYVNISSEQKILVFLDLRFDRKSGTQISIYGPQEKWRYWDNPFVEIDGILKPTGWWMEIIRVQHPPPRAAMGRLFIQIQEQYEKLFWKHLGY